MRSHRNSKAAVKQQKSSSKADKPEVLAHAFDVEPKEQLRSDIYISVKQQ